MIESSFQIDLAGMGEYFSCDAGPGLATQGQAAASERSFFCDPTVHNDAGWISGATIAVAPTVKQAKKNECASQARSSGFNNAKGYGFIERDGGK